VPIFYKPVNKILILTSFITMKNLTTILFIVLHSHIIKGQNITVSSVAGQASNSNGVGTAAQFYHPRDVAVDANGNIYVADAENHIIRKITPAGLVSTVAGSTQGFADGSGADAKFNYPTSIAIDTYGNILVADRDNHCIRKITNGHVYTLAGSIQGYAEGTGSAARFNTPNGVISDIMGNVYVSDAANNRIRKITLGGTTTTFVGNGTSGFANGEGNTAQFSYPGGLTIDGQGNILVADAGNRRIRKITPQGTVSTFAGSGDYGSLDGFGDRATFSNPSGIVVDSHGMVYVADLESNRIRKISATGEIVATLAGWNPGYLDANSLAAKFDFPTGVAVDANRNVYVADVRNHAIRKISQVEADVSTVAGGRLFADGEGLNARFSNVTDVVVSKNGNIYVPDAGNQRIRKITSNGIVTTLELRDTEGNSASFGSAIGITLDDNENIYIAEDTRIRKISPNGVVTTLAGSLVGFENGPGSQAKFYSPYGLAVDSDGNVYVGDRSNRRIRKITPAGIVSTFAGSGIDGSTDGNATTARFGTPYGVALDAHGNLFVADPGNHRIRKITPGGVVSTLAGSSQGYTDGTGGNAKFDRPVGIAIDRGGNVYVSERGNHLIRKITPSGEVTTLAGSIKGFAEGIGTIARFNEPWGLTIDGCDNLYIADYKNRLIRKIDLGSAPSTLTLTSPADNYSTGSITKQANGKINASNKITGNADVTYEAQTIELSPGFTSAEGTVFRTQIGGCE
jgi:sugar lactone lactonase YvrE